MRAPPIPPGARIEGVPTAFQAHMAAPTIPHPTASPVRTASTPHPAPTTPHPAPTSRGTPRAMAPASTPPGVAQPGQAIPGGTGGTGSVGYAVAVQRAQQDTGSTGQPTLVATSTDLGGLKQSFPGLTYLNSGDTYNGKTLWAAYYTTPTAKFDPGTGAWLGQYNPGMSSSMIASQGPVSGIQAPAAVASESIIASQPPLPIPKSTPQISVEPKSYNQVTNTVDNMEAAYFGGGSRNQKQRFFSDQGPTRFRTRQDGKPYPIRHNRRRIYR